MESYIEQNIKDIRKMVDISTRKVNRNTNDVKIVAVSKTINIDKIKEAINFGLNSLGENKVQEILEKYDDINEFSLENKCDVKWHLIGHLQTNKVKYIIDKVCMIHSVDSIKLAEEINKRAKNLGIVIDILVQVNIAKDSSKFGIMPECCEDFIREISLLSNINIKGLMTVAPFTKNSEDNRIYFRNLKKIMVDINNKKINNINMEELSMGMSGDFDVAIEEGATIIRIGTKIFGKRIYIN